MSDASFRKERVEAGERCFIVELPNEISLTRGWRDVLARAIADYPDSAAFVWDDVVLGRGRRTRSRVRRFHWPNPEPLLLAQTSTAGRCAVLEAVVRGPGGTTAALAELAGNAQDRIIHLDDVMRYVGAETSSVYFPTARPPQPSRRATGISVIINYRNHADLVRSCLMSLAGQRLAAALEILLVDNQSEAAAVADVRAAAGEIFSSRASVKHLSYDAPYNHSAQNNFAVEHSAHDVLLLLNNDAAVIDADCVQSIADWSLGPGVIAAAPRIVGEDDQLVANGVFIRPGANGQPPLLQENEAIPLSRAMRPGAGAPFACAAIARASWTRLRGLDASTFATQYNDADFWLRGLEQGMHCIYAGHVKARHQPGASEARTKQATAARLNVLRQRHPRMGEYAGLDPYFTGLGTLPDLEASTVNLKLRAMRLGERIANRLLPPKAARR